MDLSDAEQSGVVDHGEVDAAAIETSARLIGIAFARADLAGVTGREGLLDALARALSFPRGFGKDWDAFYDAVTDLDWIETPPGQDGTAMDGTVLVIENTATVAAASPDDWIEALAVLRAAVEDWKEDDIPFWVFVR